MNNSTLKAYKQATDQGCYSRQCGMCDECAKLDEKIDHYRTLMARITDQLTKEGLGKLIEEMKAQKAALHPQRET